MATLHTTHTPAGMHAHTHAHTHTPCVLQPAHGLSLEDCDRCGQRGGEGTQSPVLQSLQSAQCRALGWGLNRCQMSWLQGSGVAGTMTGAWGWGQLWEEGSSQKGLRESSLPDLFPCLSGVPSPTPNANALHRSQPCLVHGEFVSCPICPPLPPSALQGVSGWEVGSWRGPT